MHLPHPSPGPRHPELNNCHRRRHPPARGRHPDGGAARHGGATNLNSHQDSGISSPAGEGKRPEREGEGIAELAWTPTSTDVAFARGQRPDLTDSDLTALALKVRAHHGPSCTAATLSATFRRWTLTERTIRHADQIANPANSHTALPILEMVAAAPALPTSIGLLLPSISSLHDEDVVHRPDLFLELADRVARAVTDLDALETPTEPAEVVGFLAVFAERRGFGLPDPTALAMDARVVAREIPADLFPLACARLWARFRYRRLPEPPDFAMAVQEELDERRAAAARIRTVALKIRTAQMFLASRPRLPIATRAGSKSGQEGYPCRCHERLQKIPEGRSPGHLGGPARLRGTERASRRANLHEHRRC